MCNLLLAQSLSNSFNSPKLIYACLLLCFSFADRNTDTHTHAHKNTHTQRGAAKQIMKMKRESNESDGPQDQKRNRRNEETVRILIPSSVSISPQLISLLNPPPPDGQHSLMSSSIYRLPALSSAREVSTFRRCELRYLQRANCTKKPIKKMKYLDNKTQRLQKQMIN